MIKVKTDGTLHGTIITDAAGNHIPCVAIELLLDAQGGQSYLRLTLPPGGYQADMEVDEPIIVRENEVPF